MLRILALMLLFSLPALADEPLRPGAGRDTVEAACATCHTPAYIRMNSVFLTGDGWKAEVTKMRTAFGAPIDDEAAAEIIRYLTAQYGKN
jgi:mono/diheme cytochrome c family protein